MPPQAGAQHIVPRMKVKEGFHLRTVETGNKTLQIAPSMRDAGSILGFFLTTHLGAALAGAVFAGLALGGDVFVGAAVAGPALTGDALAGLALFAGLAFSGAA